MDHPMNLMVKLRRGEGPFWSTLKAIILEVLRFHVPVVGPLRWLFGSLYGVHVVFRASFAKLMRFIWYEPLFRSQGVRVGSNSSMEHLPFIAGTGRITIGDGVVFGGKPVFAFDNRNNHLPELAIGNHTFIGRFVSFSVADSIRVGDYCSIASGVQLRDYDGHPVEAARRRSGEVTPPENIRPVVVGDDVWIGTNAIILEGVHIGDRAVIGAGAVVTCDVPPDVVVAGNPARIVEHSTPRDAADTLTNLVPPPVPAGEGA